MFNLLTGVMASQSVTAQSWAPTALPSSPASRVVTPEIIPGWVIPNHSVTPTHSLNGRVTVNPLDVESEHVRDFLNGYTIEVSDNHERIDTFLKHVDQGNFPPKFIEDTELPYLAAGAFVQGKLHVKDLSNLLRWSQGVKDGFANVEVSPIFDVDGNWSEKFREYTADFALSPVQETQMKVRMQAMSKSQQTLSGSGLALEAERVFHEVKTGRQFGVEPRLGGDLASHSGQFTKSAVVKTAVELRARLMHIPYPGVLSGDTVCGNPNFTPLAFSNHDRMHWLRTYEYAPEIVDAFRELLRDFGQLQASESEVTSDMWYVADFTFQHIYSEQSYANVNGELDALIKDSGEFITIAETEEFSGWGWNMGMQMHQHRDRWHRQYGLSMEKIPSLAELNHWVKLGAPHLAGRSRLESIYLLQKLVASQASNETDVTSFFASQPACLPELKLTQILNKERGRYGRPGVSGVGSWVLAQGEALPKALQRFTINF